MPTGYDVTEKGAKKTKAFNSNLRYVQGFRSNITGSGGTTTITLSLTAAAKFILGIAVIPTTGLLTTLADTQVTFVINNNNLLLSVAANNMNPNYVQNMIFFPTPQPLRGNDNIQALVTKNDAVDTTILIDVFYVPFI